MPLRVLHVITTLDAGGAENHLLALAGAQVTRGHRVGVAYLRGDPAREAPFRAAGVKTHALNYRGRCDPPALFRLASLYGALHAHIVHGHLVEGETAAALALLAAPWPRLVVTRHNDDPFWRNPAIQQLSRLIASRAERVIAISNHVRDSFAELGVPREKLATVHYGLAVASAPPSDLRLPRPLIGSVGRLVPQKGHAMLIEALPDGAHLAIVGDGPLGADLRARAVAVGKSDRVHFLGWRADVGRLWGAFDVMAHPSLWEGLGLVLLEAMAQSRPIVASRVSAIPEIVVDGETGWLVPPGDVLALRSALSEALASPAERQRRGENGRRRLLERFSVERMAAATDDVYAAALGSR